MIELVVLDMAGTTVEEHQAVYGALRSAASAAGAAPTDEDIARWMGADKREAIAGLLGTDSAGTSPEAGVVEQTYRDFRRRLAEAYDARPPVPLPGVPEALAKLRAAGIRVALTTGFDRDVTDDLLGRLGWTVGGTVDASVCVDDVRAGRPAPYMIFRAMETTGVTGVARVAVAGDTTRDLEAGTNAGAAIVAGVLTGGQDVSRLGAVRHTHLLPSVAELADLLLAG